MEVLKIIGKIGKSISFIAYFYSILWLLTWVCLFLLSYMEVYILLTSILISVLNILYLNLENSYLTINNKFVHYKRKISFITINEFWFYYQNKTFYSDKIFFYGVKDSLYVEFDWRIEDASSIKLVSKKFKVEIYIDSENEIIFEKFIESIKKIEKPD